MLTSVKHCEELERRAQETVATNNALKTVLRQVEMSIRKESFAPLRSARLPSPPLPSPRLASLPLPSKVVVQVITGSAGDCKMARRLLKEKYRGNICVIACAAHTT